MLVKEIEVTELQSRIASGEDIALLDIRGDAEVAQGILPNAEHVEMNTIPLHLQDLPQNKDIVVYCRSGVRSYHACEFMHQQGITNVLNLRGGIIAWAQQGYEVVRPQKVPMSGQ